MLYKAARLYNATQLRLSWEDVRATDTRISHITIWLLTFDFINFLRTTLVDTIFANVFQ